MIRLHQSIIAVAASLICAGDRAGAAGTPLWLLQQNRRAAERYQQRAETQRTVHPTRVPTAVATPVPLDP